jgi:hypothetical protein
MVRFARTCAKKEPARPHTLRCSTTPAYSLTGLPARRDALYLVFRRFQPEHLLEPFRSQRVRFTFQYIGYDGTCKSFMGSWVAR